MTDRELLELAAKAIGIDGLPFLDNQYCQGALRCGYWDDLNESCWNPLEDDGDALRLVVKLKLSITIHERDHHKWSHIVWVGSVFELLHDDHGAVRRAIVRAAAEIGKEKNT